MFKFKNQTDTTLYLAFGYPEKNKETDDLYWLCIGWFHLEPNETATVHSTKLDYNCYYYYAYGDGIEYLGDTNFYVIDYKFLIKNNKDLISSDLPIGESYNLNRRIVKFQRIDVGNATKFTVNLTCSISSDLSPDEQKLLRMFRNNK